MEVGFMFKLGVGLFAIAAMAHPLIRSIDPRDADVRTAAGVVSITLCVLGTICLVIGIDLNPGDDYATFDDRRIADGACIAQETELYTPPAIKSFRSTSDEYQPEAYHRTRFTCAATEFWRKAK
jgi:hypothetical protein